MPHRQGNAGRSKLHFLRTFVETGGGGAIFTGIIAALFQGKASAVYNFGGNSEMVNLDLVRMILKRLGKPESLISFVDDRLGPDRRYAIDSSFAQRELQWEPRKNFSDGLEETVQWYLDRQDRWQPLLEHAGRY